MRLPRVREKSWRWGPSRRQRGPAHAPRCALEHLCAASVPPRRARPPRPAQGREERSTQCLLPRPLWPVRARPRACPAAARQRAARSHARKAAICAGGCPRQPEGARVPRRQTGFRLPVALTWTVPFARVYVRASGEWGRSQRARAQVGGGLLRGRSRERPRQKPRQRPGSPTASTHARQRTNTSAGPAAAWPAQSSMGLNPLWMATTPKVMSRLRAETKPASSIIPLNASWLGNWRMLSTRYWYESRSPVTACPTAGITLKLYASYAAASTGFRTRLNSKHMKRPPGRSTRNASASALSTWVTLRMPKAMV
mmetsp:Transcript_15204/g.57375  ORF Transcript_15204/g.57375 Transcript_15204/m.57375 type:complete len:312 (+) Transcript_15204:1704-2639(+)